MELMLLNFILHHFQSANINSIIVFNCWSAQTQCDFSKMLNGHSLYSRFVNIESIDMSADFEYRYLLHNRPGMGAYLDMNCKSSEQVMGTLNRSSLYNGHYNWLLYDRTADLNNFRRLFADANLDVDAELTYAFLKPTQLGAVIEMNITTFVKYDVYNNGYHLGGKLNMTVDREVECNVTSCYIKRYLSQLHTRSKYGNRDKLHDITMRVSVVITQLPLSTPVPMMLDFLTSENNSDVDPISRFGYRIMLIFKDLFGCKMRYTFRSHWGINETYGGSIGDLISCEADFLSTPFLSTAARVKYVSPLLETGGFSSICIFRTPRSSSMKGEAFVQPFDGSVWLVFVILLIVVAIFLWYTFILEMRNCRTYLPYTPSLLSTGLLAFGSACYQGSHIVPSSVGGRLAYLSLYLATFIVYNYYTSILLSTLLGTPPKSDIKTLGQLADSSLTVSLEPLPYNYVYLNASQLPDVRRFVSRKIESRKNPQKVWIPVKEGVLRVRDEPGFVYVLETSYAYPFLERNFLPHQICDLNEVNLRPDKSLFTQLHKNSSYRELTRIRGIRMLETGVFRKHRRYWVRNKLNCVPSNYLFAVGMEYTAPLFLMLAFSYILCLLLLGLELLIKRLSA
uniref:Ionotropic receptor n=2 Tax=Zeugodacus cucurbitae TaxID=28588 RepID=A0A6M9TYN7_ZEUCU|nr:ionotropic receptor [Zeugodacus cucurbitae]